jgi:hypothetical protein
MKKLNFRAYDNLRKDWVMKNFSVTGEFNLLGGGLYHYLKETKIEKVDDFDRLNQISVDQYSGLNDAQGLLIFENDYFRDNNQYMYKVIFDEGAFWLEPLDSGSDNILLGSKNSSGVVVGNIYEKLNL